MENYIVSARKYRPATFKTVVGQHALVNTLKNAVISGKLAHSYLFCGQRGVGKTTMARIFAKAINCEHLTADGEPCNECESCRAFNEQRSLNIIELDAASNNSVDDIRQLIDQVLIPPVTGKYRVFIVDEVHMLSPAAFNAFLKTLEEPPAYVIFILATTERQKILPTILSRCQKYDFQRITPADIAEQLKYVADCEGYTAEPEALNVIAQKADGAMRDALSVFDQVAASTMGNITYEATIDNLNILDYDYYFRLTDAFLDGNIEQSLLIYKEVRDHGFDSKIFINGVASHLRELAVSHSPELMPLLETTGETARRYQEQSARCRMGKIYAAMDLCNTCDLNYAMATNKRFLVELTLIKICQLFNNDNPSPQPTGETIKKIEKPSSAPATPTVAKTENKPQPIKTAEKKSAQMPTPPTKHQTAATVSPTFKPVGVPSISLKEKLSEITVNEKNIDYETKKEEQPNQISAATARNEHYSDEDLKEAWRQFVRTHPDDIILINSMKTGFPNRNGAENSFLYEVENKAQKEAFDRKIGDLTRFLRDSVKNDNIQIAVKVREIGEKEKPITQKELLIDLVERNPKAKKFIDRYHLGFSN